MGLWSEFKHTVSYCKPQWRLYLAGIVALFLVDVADVAAPWLIKLGIGSATRRNEPGYEPSFLEEWLPAEWFADGGQWFGMWVHGLAYVAAVGFAGYFRYWMSMTFSRAQMNIATDLRNRFYGHVQRLPASWHDHSTTGNVMSLATNDIDACRFFWGFGLLLAIDTLFYLMLTPVMMLSISWELTLMCLIPAPIMPFLIVAVARRIEKRFEEVQEQFSTLSDRASESFNGIKVVKSFGAEPQEERRFSELSLEYQKRALKLARVQSLQDPMLMCFVGAMQFIVLAYGGWLTLEGKIGEDDFVAFFFLLLRLASPVMTTGMVIAMYQRCIVSRRRIEEVLSHPTEPVPVGPPATTPADRDVRGDVTIRNLTFAYPDETRPALRDVSVDIPAGSTVAFIGDVGSGKSTILSVLARLYEPPRGTVFLDGRDILDWDLDTLRRAVVAVPQETFLFGETIAENIAYGVDDDRRDPARIRECARIARIDGDIEALPKGYDTMLGERGVNLSGGQRQRVAIARALAGEPRLLLLDDCLSAVDSQTEESILASLRKATKSLTTLIVSNRVSAVRHASHICVLSGGRIAERGTHEELVALDGWYADLVRRQRLEDEIAQSA